MWEYGGLEGYLHLGVPEICHNEVHGCRSDQSAEMIGVSAAWGAREM